MVTAVLIDTVSIQKYVFASNRLKENLGASQLVADIYQDELSAALHETIGTDINIHQWKQKPEEIQMLNGEVKCEIGYIGGGNALLFFADEDIAKQFIYNWSKRLLVNAPGLQTAVAISQFNFTSYQKDLERLYRQLNENKNRYFPNTVLAKYGITADCPFSGLTAEVCIQDEDDGEYKYISSVLKTKLDAAEKSQKNIERLFNNELGDEYKFTARIDQLGQKEGENYLAIVHIDGNAMGERFAKCPTLKAIRKLSCNVEKATVESFKNLLTYIIEQIPLLKKDNAFKIHEEDGKCILPIRPIVIAGDDITFVTDGRLGVHFAEKFIEYLEKQKVDSQLLTACAGIAIIKTKSPFFQGYKLAEELCSFAKKESRKNNNKSMLDFYIAVSGYSGSLTQIREKHYRVKEGKLYFGPYFINDKDNEKSIIRLKRGIKQLTSWPRSKVKELHSTLLLGKVATKKFITDLEIRDLHLPKVYGNYDIEGWDNSRTPYYDMIQLMEFYPQIFLENI